jgi:hypothetical protein
VAGDIVGGQRLLNPQQVERFEQLERAQRLRKFQPWLASTASGKPGTAS